MLKRSGKHESGEGSPLTFPKELLPFVLNAPLPVLVRSTLEWMLKQATLDELFEQTAQDQYTRELTLTFLVDLMLDVASGIQPSALKAFNARATDLVVSRQALYAKLRRMEPAVSAAVVGQLATLAGQAIEHLGSCHGEPIPGYQARVVDGTVLGGRCEHRIKPLRNLWSAGLTAHALAVYAPAQRIVRQVALDEDAYSGERTLLYQLQVEAGELWIADRNFCARPFLFRLHRARCVFLMRWHGRSCPFDAIEPLHAAHNTAQGVLEQAVWLEDPESQERLQVRRIVLPLAAPTRNGDTELVLMTNLPDTVAADQICDAYRDRWTIETHFQRLTQQLHCEPSALSYPRAALFAFAMAVSAGNALAVVQQALQDAHGEDAVTELSYYAVVLEISQIWLGMAIVMPTEKWKFIRHCRLDEFIAWLRYVAQHVRMDRFKRSRRGPKKPQTKKPMDKNNLQFHVSIKRLLDQNKTP
jgi:hypothetical protein